MTLNVHVWLPNNVMGSIWFTDQQHSNAHWEKQHVAQCLKVCVHWVALTKWPEWCEHLQASTVYVSVMLISHWITPPFHGTLLTSTVPPGWKPMKLPQVAITKWPEWCENLQASSSGSVSHSQQFAHCWITPLLHGGLLLKHQFWVRRPATNNEIDAMVFHLFFFWASMSECQTANNVCWMRQKCVKKDFSWKMFMQQWMSNAFAFFNWLFPIVWTFVSEQAKSQFKWEEIKTLNKLKCDCNKKISVPRDARSQSHCVPHTDHYEKCFENLFFAVMIVARIAQLVRAFDS